MKGCVSGSVICNVVIIYKCILYKNMEMKFAFSRVWLILLLLVLLLSFGSHQKPQYQYLKLP